MIKTKKKNQEKKMSDIVELDEAKFKYKVNSKGKKTKRLKCKPGYKIVGSRCEKISGSDKVAKKKSIRKGLRTKKSDVAGKRRSVKKRLKAMKKRKSMGLKGK